MADFVSNRDINLSVFTPQVFTLIRFLFQIYYYFRTAFLYIRDDEIIQCPFGKKETIAVAFHICCWFIARKDTILYGLLLRFLRWAVFTLSRHFVPFLSREDKKKKLRNLNVRLLSFIFCFVAIPGIEPESQPWEGCVLGHYTKPPACFLSERRCKYRRYFWTDQIFGRKKSIIFSNIFPGVFLHG